MLQNADQRRDKDDRAEYIQEEECEAFIAHVTKHKVSALRSIFEQMVKQPGKAFHKAKTRFRVKEEPGQ